MAWSETWEVKPRKQNVEEIIEALPHAAPDKSRLKASPLYVRSYRLEQWVTVANKDEFWQSLYSRRNCWIVRKNTNNDRYVGSNRMAVELLNYDDVLFDENVF